MGTADLTRRLSAILSADVEGYSRLMRDDDEATVQTITTYRAAMTHLIQEYRGRVVDSPGDNILAEFTSVVDAVNCGVELQRELAERNAELSENRQMRFRIGINLGDILQEGKRIYGDGVNIAARLESLAEAGGLCISGTVYDAIENKVGLEYEYLGEQEVKNIDKPVRAYRVLSFPGAAAHRVLRAKKAVGRSWRKVVLAIAAVLILGAGALAAWHFYLRPAPPPAEVASEKTAAPESPKKTPPPIPDEPSIAVLPFANISGDPKEDYLSDGITEQIITALSKTPKMLVIARNSVFTYKGKPVMVQQVSEELGVRYVLEGSVQKEGDQLRITAQLIDAKTGNHLWAERYDRDLKDLFNLQDDITKNVITALQVKLTLGDSARIYGEGTANLEVHLKAMKGLAYVRRFNKDDHKIAQRLFGEAIELDPNYANAYVLLATTYYNEVNFGWTDTPAKSLEKAMELAKKAISLDEQNAGAYMVFANVYLNTGQFKKAEAAQEKALSLDPDNSYINALCGRVLFLMGKFKEAIGVIKKAMRIDPKPPSWYLQHLGLSYFYTGQNEEAIAGYRKWVSREPKNTEAHGLLGGAFVAAGQPEEAIAMFERALSLNPNDPVWYSCLLSVARLGAGQPEAAITMLREALSRDPKNAELLLWLSVALTSEGKYEEALSMVKKAISFKKMSPSFTPDADFYCFLGVPYLMMSQYEEAIAAGKKTISLWPEHVYGHILLTAAYNMSGGMEDARAEAAEVLKINPKITLEDIAKNGYLIYRKADKERFINALRKAGLK